jgi:hypothetical protein
MPTTPLPVLAYADPSLKVRPRWPYVLWRLLVSLLQTAWVLTRIAMLTAGFVLTVVGTILLMAGGQESAGREIGAYGRQIAGVLRKWRADLARPLQTYWNAYVDSFHVAA